MNICNCPQFHKGICTLATAKNYPKWREFFTKENLEELAKSANEMQRKTMEESKKTDII